MKKSMEDKLADGIEVGEKMNVGIGRNEPIILGVLFFQLNPQ